MKSSTNQHLVLFFLILLAYPSWRSPNAQGSDLFLWDLYPKVSLNFENPLPNTVFYAETLRIPMRMHFKHLWINKVWHIPHGLHLENVTGTCPILVGDKATYGYGTCFMNLVLEGTQLGQVIEGRVRYTVQGQEGSWPNKHSWKKSFDSPTFSIQVIPHPLSMSVIPIQTATINHFFRFELKKSINYYDENVLANTPAQGDIDTEELSKFQELGLYFNSTHLSIEGIPKKTGTYTFNVSVKNANGRADATRMIIDVGVNSKDQPVFKPQYSIPSALSGQKYSVNLMELLKPYAGFMENNSITFCIKSNPNNPEWLHLSTHDSTRLEGIVPTEDVGQEVDLELLASSNTGGETEPFRVKIPILYGIDTTQTPRFKAAYPMVSLAYIGHPFFYDFAANRDIYPDYEESAYQVEFAKNYEHPDWLIVKNNQLIAEKIPEDTTSLVSFHLVIKNRPGGSSEVIRLSLMVMN